MITSKEYLTFDFVASNVASSSIRTLENLIASSEYKEEQQLLAEAQNLIHEVRRRLRTKHESPFA